MPIDLKRLLVAAAVIQFITACTTSSSALTGADNVGWGEANRQTMAAQIIDPAPQYETAIPETSGDHVANAIDRYRNDKVKRPERVKTSSVSESSGSGSSSD